MGMLDGMFKNLFKKMREHGGCVYAEEQIYREEITIGPDGKPQTKSMHVRREMSEDEARKFMELSRQMFEAFRSPEEMRAHMERVLREMSSGAPTLEGLREAMRRASRQ